MARATSSSLLGASGIDEQTYTSGPKRGCAPALAIPAKKPRDAGFHHPHQQRTASAGQALAALCRFDGDILSGSDPCIHRHARERNLFALSASYQTVLNPRWVTSTR